MKYGMCMDKNVYIIHMKYVMYNRTEGNKCWKKTYPCDQNHRYFFGGGGPNIAITFRIVLLAYTMFIMLSWLKNNKHNLFGLYLIMYVPCL